MKQDKGFTLLIAIVVTSLMLLISFVVTNVALKQLIISSAGIETQYAFYAADSGTDCALYWDLKDSNLSAFATSTVSNPSATIYCNGQSISTGSQNDIATNPLSVSRIGGGGNGAPTSIFQLNFTKGCAIVRVTKQDNGQTAIDSRGYNTCSTSALRRFERGITLAYQGNTTSFGTPAVTRNLTVTKAGTGTGTVTAGSAINCGSTCSSIYDDGAAVSLSAVAGSGSNFSSWSGDCSGSGSCNVTMSADRNVTANFQTSPMSATGGAITFAGGYTIHTFTNPNDTFVVNSPGTVEYLIVGGGGGGGRTGGGGGGGGGFVASSASITNGTYPITVGAGGAGSQTSVNGSNGGSSTFNGISALGGGGGGTDTNDGVSGASGGGAGADSSVSCGGGTLTNTGGTGNPGGNGGRGYRACGSRVNGGGGGGAGGGGNNATISKAGNGGAGLSSSISGVSVSYAGGGGGGANSTVPDVNGFGAGGGGNGSIGAGTASTAGVDGRGGGGGGGEGSPSYGARGGSGVVIIRYLTN